MDILQEKIFLNSSAGNSKMQDIASAIQIGAKAYLANIKLLQLLVLLFWLL